MKGLVVAGIGTGVGKTFISAIVTEAAREAARELAAPRPQKFRPAHALESHRRDARERPDGVARPHRQPAAARRHS